MFYIVAEDEDSVKKVLEGFGKVKELEKYADGTKEFMILSKDCLRMSVHGDEEYVNLECLSDRFIFSISSDKIKEMLTNVIRTLGDKIFMVVVHPIPIKYPFFAPNYLAEIEPYMLWYRNPYRAPSLYLVGLIGLKTACAELIVNEYHSFIIIIDLNKIVRGESDIRSPCVKRLLEKYEIERLENGVLIRFSKPDEYKEYLKRHLEELSKE